jgi:hypothetical protein
MCVGVCVSIQNTLGMPTGQFAATPKPVVLPATVSVAVPTDGAYGLSVSDTVIAAGPTEAGLICQRCGCKNATPHGGHLFYWAGGHEEDLGSFCERACVPVDQVMAALEVQDMAGLLGCASQQVPFSLPFAV